MSILYLGIDPGKSGAICSVDVYGNPEVITKASETNRDMWKAISDIAIVHKCRAVIEQVSAMPNQGVASTFRFGESFGVLLGLLTAAEIPFERVRPSLWCKEFGLKRKQGESGTEWKNRHKQLAQELFPGIATTHAIADALLIAEYCRRKNI